MFEEYREKYPELYKIITNELNTNHLNHAYLIETTENAEEISKEIAKKIILYQQTEEEQQVLNKLIEENIYPDIKVISTDKQWIQKEQILEIQEEFKNKSIYNNKRIYIILEADKLNKSSANTLLKFLEEPNDDIIAILMTTNIYSVIETIVSRCQTIKIKKDNQQEIDVEMKNIALKFITIVEKYQEKAIAHIQEIPELFEMTRDDLVNFLQYLIYFYEDVLHSFLELVITYYKSEIKKVEEIKDNNTIDKINQKIQAIDYCINKIKYNTNIKLIMDKLILLMNKK